MGVQVDAVDVFEMAVQIEHDAAGFYRRAAQATRTERCRQMLLNLASMEAEHEQIFEGLLSTAGEGGPAPGRRDGAQPRQISLVHLMASGIQEDLAGRFTGGETAEEILRKALEFEKDTIVFLLAAKRTAGLAGCEGRKVNRLVQEELGHILMLAGELLPAAPRPAAAGGHPRRPADPRRAGRAWPGKADA